MKKIFIFLLSALSLTVFAQQKKVAVYVTGNDPINDIVSSRLMDGIAKSGKYLAIERTASFLGELSKEQNYQSTGAVDDNEISRLGKHFGVDYVCVASAFDVWGAEKYISTRLIDVESAEVIVSSSSNGSIASSSELIAALNTLSDGLLSSFEQSKLSTAKKVAVYVSRTGNKDVDLILGDQLVAGFAHSGRYFAIERTQGFLNQLSKEQDYQHTGAVDDAELTRLGKQFGVHYVCIAKTSQIFGDYFISTRLIDVETATVVNSCNLEGVQLSNAQNVIIAAQEIAGKLSDKTIQEIAYEKEQERLRIEQEQKILQERFGDRVVYLNQGYVDLGLPSNTLWAESNEGYDSKLYSWEDDISIEDFFVDLPSVEQFEELIKLCTWEWTYEQGMSGYKVTGPNGSHIFLPAAGSRYSDGEKYDSGRGHYWSVGLYSVSSAYYLEFRRGYTPEISRDPTTQKKSVRLVK